MDMCVSLGTHTHSSQVTQCPLLPQQAPSDLCRVGVPARPGSGGGGCGGAGHALILPFLPARPKEALQNSDQAREG